MSLAAVMQNMLSTPSGFSTTAFLDAIFHHAVSSRASDVHIDPTEEDVRIRFRIDGELEDVAHMPLLHLLALISKVKVLSQLRTDEHQAAQDGRFRISVEDKPVDIRVAISPTYYGERVVLRLLTQRSSFHTLKDLGMSEADRIKLEYILHQPHGMILASGPTGSGKTTTLYSLLQLVHQDTVSVITVEDPIEYAIKGACQIQVNPRTNLSFATGLRSILRQDPNIIMVGEIRDGETARLSTNTALTGHLLLSTIHTNDAATTLLRLLDLGVEPYLISSTVSAVIAQRLVRTVCGSCTKEYSYVVRELPQTIRAHIPELDVIAGAKGAGCGECRGSGYKGRMALFEILYITPGIRSLILRRVPASEIVRQAMSEAMRTMAADGVEKVLLGLTTPEEVARALSD